MAKGNGGEDVPTNLVPSKRSSKRSRAVEVHNLSKKRRRRRINEKMKALQHLILNFIRSAKMKLANLCVINTSSLYMASMSI
ncbi:hypothetical protein HN873_004751 [Arachis hypogaea]